MKWKLLLLLLFAAYINPTLGQRARARSYDGNLNKKLGVGFFPFTNSFGVRYNISDRFTLEGRLNYHYLLDSTISFYNKVRFTYRVDLNEYSNFYIGFGAKSAIFVEADTGNYIWGEVPIGAEIFPSNTVPNFSIIAEANPYYLVTDNLSDLSGLFIVFGLVYYF